MTEKTYDYIADGLKAYKALAKYSLKHRWKNMTLRQKCDAGRSLSVMGIMAKDPKGFGTNGTKALWKERSQEYAGKHILRQEDYNQEGLVISESPRDYIWFLSRNALNYPLTCEYYTFLGLIQDYEYANEDEKEKYAKKIAEDSMRISAFVALKEFQNKR